MSDELTLSEREARICAVALMVLASEFDWHGLDELQHHHPQLARLREPLTRDELDALSVRLLRGAR
jgi:hypothetical protein